MTSFITEEDPIRLKYKQFLISIRQLMDIACDLTFYPSHKKRLISLKSDLWKYWHTLNDLRKTWNDPFINEDFDYIIRSFKQFYNNVKRIVEKKNLYTISDNNLINSILIEDTQTARIFLMTTRNEIEKRIINISLNSLQETYIEKLKEIHRESYSSFERYRIDYCNGVGSLHRGLSSYNKGKEELSKILPLIIDTLRAEHTDCDNNGDTIYKSWQYQNTEMAEEIELFKEVFEKMTLLDFIKNGKDFLCFIKDSLYKPFCDFFEKRYNEKVETII